MPQGAAAPSESPVLCLDTCSVLDILRDPARPEVGVKEQAASLYLLNAAEAVSALEVRVADQVLHEYAARVEGVREETTRTLSKLRCQIRKVDQLAALHGAAGHVTVEHWDGHADRCHQAADRWIRVAKPVPPPPDVLERAYVRLMKPLRPARLGKSEMKDCVVLETYLEFVTKVREKSARTVVFVSSNTKDYANEGRNDVADEIKNEFLAIDLKYAQNMRAARRLLGLW